jgi:transcriptional regulator with XRE-family HTH domain
MRDVNQRIAARVRSLRTARGLSLEALASRSAVSRSMISRVERGEASATAVLLEKIATGLGCTLASLFDEGGANGSPVSRGADRSTWQDPESGYRRRNISPANISSPLRIVDVHFPAGATVAFETSSRANDIAQQIWLLSGAIEVTVGAVTHHLQADDCLAMSLDAPVTFRNRTRKEAHYIVVIAS